jgi:hypothetical protein
MSNLPIAWIRNRGRNGWDSFLDVGPESSVVSINVHLHEGGLGTRRGGLVSVTTTGVTQPITSMAEFVPAQDLTAAELFVADSASPVALFRCAAGSTFSALTVADAISNATEMSFVSMNGKLFVAYNSPVNRLHVYEPAYSTTALRKVGMGTAAAPSVADTGGGAYAATTRYYKVRFLEVRSGLVTRDGEASASTAFTPSGAGSAARISRPALLSEGEAYWQIEVSLDDVTYYVLAVVATGTTTYDDSAATSSYASGVAAAVSGTRTPFPSVKWLATDGAHLIGFGVWESSAGDSVTPRAGRVYISPALGAISDVYMDDERVINSATQYAWLDLSRNSSAVDRGITPKPVNGNLFAFQSNGVYALVPTESGIRPYRRVVLDSTIGNLDARAVVCGQDRKGAPCAFFLDPVKGPYIVGGADGLCWIGKDVFDVWETLKRDATGVVAWGMWYPDLNQVKFWIATNNSDNPDLVLVLDVTELHPDEDGDLRGGWTTYDGVFASARCGVLFSNTLAATRSSVRVPYLGTSGQGLGRYSATATDDNGNGISAPTIRSGAIVTRSAVVSLLRSYLITERSGSASVAITQSLRPNGLAALERASTILVDSTETFALKKFEDAALQDAFTFQVQLLASGAAPFTIRRWLADVSVGAPL